MKVFISQPMRWKSDEEIVEERDAAYRLIFRKHGENTEILESYKPEKFADEGPLKCLGESLKIMADADVVYFLPGWQEARGCVIERNCAAMYGIPAAEIDEL